MDARVYHLYYRSESNGGTLVCKLKEGECLHLGIEVAILIYPRCLKKKEKKKKRVRIPMCRTRGTVDQKLLRFHSGTCSQLRKMPFMEQYSVCLLARHSPGQAGMILISGLSPKKYVKHERDWAAGTSSGTDCVG